MDGLIKLWSNFPSNPFDKAWSSLLHFHRDLPRSPSHLLTKTQSLNLPYLWTDRPFPR